MPEGEPGTGPYALAWSGGKDSTLAYHRTRRRGYRVPALLTVYDAETGRTGFHGVRKELIAAQAEALGLEAMLEPIGEGDEFEQAFGRGLDRLVEGGFEGIVFGNIHLEDVRAWYEERTTRRGLRHVEPLWGEPPGQLVREFLRLGYRTIVVSVNLESGKASWLGRELDGEMLAELEADPEVDPCGEKGEYHTFAWAGPEYRRPVAFRTGQEVEMRGHRLLDLLPEEEREPDAASKAGRENPE